jgi:hypothetical protein
MPSSRESSASIVTSWIIKVPQLPESSFGARHSREIKIPEVLGDTFGTFEIRCTAKSTLNLSSTARIM